MTQAPGDKLFMILFALLGFLIIAGEIRFRLRVYKNDKQAAAVVSTPVR